MTLLHDLRHCAGESGVEKVQVWFMKLAVSDSQWLGIDNDGWAHILIDKTGEQKR